MASSGSEISADAPAKRNEQVNGNNQKLSLQQAEEKA